MLYDRHDSGPACEEELPKPGTAAFPARHWPKISCFTRPDGSQCARTASQEGQKGPCGPGSIQTLQAALPLFLQGIRDRNTGCPAEDPARFQCASGCQGPACTGRVQFGRIAYRRAPPGRRLPPGKSAGPAVLPGSVGKAFADAALGKRSS